MDSSYDFAVVDSNSLQFVFKHAPEVARELRITSELSFHSTNLSVQETWLVITVEVLDYSGSSSDDF